MRRHIRTTILYGIAMAAMSIAPHASAITVDEASAAAFGRLQSIAGVWRVVTPRTEREAALRITFRPIARATAIVEDFGNPATGVTETIYHRDGLSVMVTHYCAQGNQPRLRLRMPATDGALVFDFVDATNLPDVTKSHLVRIRLDGLNSPRLIKEETYVENGREVTTRYELMRLPK